MNNAKLVRDKIPGIIKKQGRSPVFYIAEEKEYWKKLKEKLEEEVNEFLADETEEELADVLEIFYAICKYKKIRIKDLEIVRKKKLKERGGFDKKIILES